MYMYTYPSTIQKIFLMKTEIGSCDPDHAQFKGDLLSIIHTLRLDTAYLCSKFDHCRFSHSRNMVGAHQNL